MKRILIVGYGRAGKDESALMLSEITKIPYAGSTSWAGKEIVAKVLNIHPQVAWEKRHVHREQWKAILDKYREADPRKLFVRALASLEENRSKREVYFMQGIVAGIRDKKELVAVKASGYTDYILWIERPGTPLDPTVTFTKEDCDEVIHNDAGLIHLHSKLFLWAEKRGLIPHLYLTPTQDQFRDDV